MVMTKEQRREYAKIFYQKNKDKIKAYRRINKQKIAEKKKIYNEKNKKKIKEYNQSPNRKKSYRIYHQTPKGKKSMTISGWKRQGIITDDYDYWYNLYIEQNHCWHCENQFTSSMDRHLDHNHNIKDKENIRGILCRSCNVKDIYK